MINPDSDIASEIPIETGKSKSGECRPEGPPVNRPDREVGITQLSEMSAEGAALQSMFMPSAAPSALISILIPLSRPHGRAY